MCVHACVCVYLKVRVTPEPVQGLSLLKINHIVESSFLQFLPLGQMTVALVPNK